MLLPEAIPGRVGLVEDPFVWIRISLRACVLLALPWSLEVVVVWSKCCVRRGLFGLFRGAHMLKTVAICSNLLVLILLGVWVVGGIEFDVNYSHIGPV